MFREQILPKKSVFRQLVDVTVRRATWYLHPNEPCDTDTSSLKAFMRSLIYTGSFAAACLFYGIVGISGAVGKTGHLDGPAALAR